MKVTQDVEALEDNFAKIVLKVRDTLRRRWRIFSLVTFVIFAAAVAIVLILPDKYTAIANVRIDPDRSPNAQDQSDVRALTPEAIETEVSLINSNDVALAVVRKLHLDKVPELTKGLDGTPMSQTDREAVVAATILKHLDVGRDKLSYILAIGYTAKSRQLAADVANGFAEAYLNAKIGSQNDTASKKGVFLNQQLTELGNTIRGSESQLANYQAASGLAGTSTANGSQALTIVDQQIAPLSAALATAQSDAAEANATLSAAEGQAASGNSDRVSEVLASPVIGQLRAQRATTVANMGEVTTRYGEKHPETIRVRGQLKDIDDQIQAETNRVIASLRAKARSAEAREASLKGQIDALGVKQATNARNAVLANALQADITTKRAQYDKLSQAALESSQAANNSIASAVIVDAAKPPLVPSAPNRILLIALGLIVACAAGGGTIALQEMMVSGIRTMAELEGRLGIPMLAAVPMQKAERPADALLGQRTSLFSEAFRIARASILGVRSAHAMQVIAITSSLPSEGKTTTALAFARTLAVNGQKTLLIDCDVRRASLRTIVDNPSNGPGLVELLHGEAVVSETINRSESELLDYLYTREPFFSSANLFGDGKMEKILDSLRGRYELIVLDLPPLLGLADGRFLAAMSDAVAIVLRWNSTPTQAATAALRSLKSDNAPVVGAIFTMVDVNAEAIGGLYYSKKYAGYYQAA